MSVTFSLADNTGLCKGSSLRNKSTQYEYELPKRVIKPLRNKRSNATQTVSEEINDADDVTKAPPATSRRNTVESGFASHSNFEESKLSDENFPSAASQTFPT